MWLWVWFVVANCLPDKGFYSWARPIAPALHSGGYSSYWGLLARPVGLLSSCVESLRAPGPSAPRAICVSTLQPQGQWKCIKKSNRKVSGRLLFLYLLFSLLFPYLRVPACDSVVSPWASFLGPALGQTPLLASALDPWLEVVPAIPWGAHSCLWDIAPQLLPGSRLLSMPAGAAGWLHCSGPLCTGPSRTHKWLMNHVGNSSYCCWLPIATPVPGEYFLIMGLSGLFSHCNSGPWKGVSTPFLLLPCDKYKMIRNHFTVSFIFGSSILRLK